MIVLSCLALPCLALSCLVIVSSCLVFSRFVKTYLVLFFVLFWLVMSRRENARVGAEIALAIVSLRDTYDQAREDEQRS